MIDITFSDQLEQFLNSLNLIDHTPYLEQVLYQNYRYLHNTCLGFYSCFLKKMMSPNTLIFILPSGKSDLVSAIGNILRINL